MRLEDHELLRRFGSQTDQEAFAELARRHLPGVLATARRYLADAALAQDAAQLVLTRLAQRWNRVPANAVLAAWLHADTRLVSLQILRAERRREAREQHAMIEVTTPPVESPDWHAIRPLLDEALALLGAPDRDALFLRFFEQRSLREVGDRLGLGEDAARMRLARALDRLREALRRRGVTTTAAALSASLAAHASPAVPPAVAQALISATLTASTTTITAALGIAGGTPSLAGTSAATSAVSTLLMSKTSVIFGAALLLGIAYPLLQQSRENALLCEDLRALRATIESVQRQAASSEEQLRTLLSEAQAARGRAAELAGLREELRRLREPAPSGTTSTNRAVSPNASIASAPPKPPFVEVDVARFWTLSPSDQGDFLASVRRPPPLHTLPADLAAGFARNQQLAGEVRAGLDALEDKPVDFAAFQAAFIQKTIDLQDPSRVAQLRELIQKTYEQAVRDGLVASARPAEGIEDWARRRDALDRAATRTVQGFLTAEERQAFDAYFLGIMGIDLGQGDGSWYRFVRPDGAVEFPSEAPPAARLGNP